MPILDQVLKTRAQGLRIDVQRKVSGEKLLSHLPTGFTAIDNTFGGIRRGVLTELMAHTGDGKSAFARQISEAVAKAGAGVLWFCAEDPEDATAERFLADGTSITATDMGRLDITNTELSDIDKAAKTAESWARNIDIRFEAPTVDECLEALYQTKEVNGAKVLLGIFDYAQIFGDSKSLEGEIAKLSTGLNLLSGDFRIACLLLSQVANEVLKRGREAWNNQKSITGFIPTLGDTEWCRRAEKSSKAIWSLFRPNRWRREMGEDVEDNTAELHVKKASFGPTGWEELSWDGPGVRFGNL